MIQDLRLQQFRSYKDETFEFDKGVNIIVGPNASGKTNLLEALLYIAKGKSYRVSSAGLIAFDASWARLEAHTDGDSRIMKIDARTTALPQKTYDINSQTFRRLPFNQTLPVVLFEPDHLRLLHGSPEHRRNYLDDLLEQTTPGYSRIRQAYRRVLQQRNALIKQKHPSLNDQLFAWNVRLSDLGGQIVQARSAITTQMNQKLPELYAQLSGGKTTVTLKYISDGNPENYSTGLLHRLESQLQRDLERGFTAHGPHRDDVEFLFDAVLADNIASRGEVRTLLLALKIVELQLLEAVRGQKPLLLLDDVFSELDGARRQALTNYLTNYQTFITTTDADVVIQHFMDSCRIIPTAMP